MIARLVNVTGRVQGVGFRWRSLQRAVALGLGGWVRNEPDGSVTVHLEGEADAVADMIGWLTAGPPAARVDAVDVDAVEPTGMASFDIVR